jgi:hypothetical protein
MASDKTVPQETDVTPQGARGWSGRQKLWVVFWGYGVLGIPLVVLNLSALRIPCWGTRGFGTLWDTPAFIFLWVFCFYLMWWIKLLRKSSSNTGWRVGSCLATNLSSLVNIFSWVIFWIWGVSFSLSRDYGINHLFTQVCRS